MTTAVLDVYLTEADGAQALRSDARVGLTSTPKDLPPKWFYDDRGSQLFDEITRLPEYYPTRTERSILVGFKVTVSGHSVGAMNKEYMVVSHSFTAVNGLAQTASGSGSTWVTSRHSPKRKSG